MRTVAAVSVVADMAVVADVAHAAADTVATVAAAATFAHLTPSFEFGTFLSKHTCAAKDAGERCTVVGQMCSTRLSIVSL